MKKLFIIISFTAFLFAACNPNEELYQNIEKNTPPYKTDFEITLSEDDYSSIADLAEPQTAEDSAAVNAIDEQKSFGHNRSASDYVGAFLDQEYLGPDSASSVKVTYKYDLNEYDSISVYELSSDDYTSIGGAVADSSAFSYIKKPGNYLPDFLYEKDTTSQYLMYVTSEYIKRDFSRIDTSIVYIYNEGEWQICEQAYILTETDYDSMGAPGEYDNFSESVQPEDYLLTFMSERFPYAFENETKIVFYDYYDSGVSTFYEVYKLTGGSWMQFEYRTDQFVHNGEQWLFDPTVKYTMVKSDYDILVQYIKNHPELSGYFDDYYENSEYYYGASAHYDNFDMRIYKRRDNDTLGLLTDLSDAEVKAELTERLKEGLVIFLEERFPNAEPVSNGVQIYYEVYYATYEPGDYYYKMRFKVTDVGRFEYESGPVSLQ